MTENELNKISDGLYKRLTESLELVNALLEQGKTKEEIDAALRYNFQSIINWAEFGFNLD
jgi:hypothetical protein